MDQKLYNSYVKILKNELVPALGCTEPIAIAYAAAKAHEVLGQMPEKIELCCSGNIIKNVKGVKVPNSNGLKGIDVAATLGVVGGRADRELEVLRELVAGESDAAIAEKLFMSLRTVKSHIQSMREKTGFRNRTELAVRARESGLVINNK